MSIGITLCSSVIIMAEGQELRIEGRSNVNFSATLERHYKMGGEVGCAQLGQAKSALIFSPVQY